jgi:hypothetical protein
MHPLIVKELASIHANDLLAAAERGRPGRRRGRGRKGILRGIAGYLAALRGLV